VRTRVLVVGGLVVALAVATGATWHALTRPDHLHVTVDGSPYQVAAQTTLATFEHLHHLSPSNGSVLSVTGHVLRRDAYPGRVLVNGAREPGSYQLRDGDRIITPAGKNRVEQTTIARRVVRGGQTANPMFTLARTPGYEVITKGRISGEVKSARFHPTGQARTPRTVALTFDDGPWPGQTKQILRILRRAHVPATFFLIGRQANTRPSLVRDELHSGMTVGDHSWDHPLTPPFNKLSAVRITQEIRMTRTVIDRAGGHVSLFRPPGGDTSTRVVRIAGQLGCRVVLWSVDPRDWAPGVTSKRIVHRVLSQATAGSIILLHDGGGDRSATIKALPTIIHRLGARDLRFVSL
jgi:peptidoglycan-N-acetylglucosamine deacetylase